MIRAILAAILLCSSASSAAGQVLGSIEVRRDRFAYRFENPSSIDTVESVPHFFEQRYRLDNIWAVVTARYRAGVPWETSVGVTPERRSVADDYDTFFDPDGTVWVSGTTGDARVRSLAITERAMIGHVRAFTVSAGYKFRLDRTTFLPGPKTVTRNGAAFQSLFVTDREFTSGQLHEIFAGTSYVRPVGRRWQLALDGDLSAAAARLLIQLPDKYPGQDLIFRTGAITGNARASLGSTGTTWPVEIFVEGGRAWNYRSRGRIERNALGAGVSIGKSW